jgi:molybdopterin synthase sulfur carrier subunit
MSITVCYFASLKDLSGCDQQQLDPILPADVKSIWSYAHPDKPLPPNVLAAVNMEYVNLETLVKDGDEVAFFPPVTGG